MIESGTLLQNRYRVARQIGVGGMGAVYVATDERFNSTVAIKQTFFFDDPALCKAFEREAHLLNHLRHAALPKVSDHFTEGTGQFLVMEFIEGLDFGMLLKERGGAFPVADVLRWADELLDALDYLHAHKPAIIHRDIKPQNIKLTARGQVVLLDFGLAKGTPAQTHASATASVLGYSPQYAPLEQVQGTGTDPRSDLYSLGATLYHLLTGVAPVDALTRAGAVINNQPDPLRPAHVVNAKVPSAVGMIVQRSMAQKASLRPKTAAEMRDMLRQAAGVAPHVARKAPASASFVRGRSEFEEATVLEQPSLSAELREATLLGETTVDAKAFGGSRWADRTHVPQPFQTQPPEPANGAWAKLLIVAAVLAICAVAAFTVIPRSGTPASEIEVQTDPALGAPADAPASKQAGATGESPYNSPVAETSPAQSQPTAAPAAASASNAQPASAATEKTVGVESTGGSAAGSSEANNPATLDGATTGSRPGLVIQRPAPSPQPTQPAESRPAPVEDSRRAEEFQRRPPPPPPDGGRFPPPGGHHPPPHRPPPRRP